MGFEPEKTLVQAEVGADRATTEGDGRVGRGRACGLRHGRGRRRRRWKKCGCRGRRGGRTKWSVRRRKRYGRRSRGQRQRHVTHVGIVIPPSSDSKPSGIKWQGARPSASNTVSGTPLPRRVMILRIPVIRLSSSGPSGVLG